MNENKINHFTDLITWQEAHKLALMVYKLTQKFPPPEQYGLVSQMRRSAISISSNIAEGFGRRTGKEKIRFYDIAIGSLFELQNQFFLSKDLLYLEIDYFTTVHTQSVRVNSLLNGLIKTAL